MGITSSGPICDVCGKYILDPEDHVNEFSVKGINKVLICDDACKAKMLAIDNDWHKLPDGPLKKAFQEAEGKGE